MKDFSEAHAVLRKIVIEEITKKYIENGWRLHTYFPVGDAIATAHYLLFEKETEEE